MMSRSRSFSASDLCGGSQSGRPAVAILVFLTSDASAETAKSSIPSADLPDDTRRVKRIVWAVAGVNDHAGELAAGRRPQIRTEQGAWCTIAVATLPNAIPVSRGPPCEPTEIRSAFSSAAALRSADTELPRSSI